MKTLVLAILGIFFFANSFAQTIDGWFPFEIASLDTFDVEFAPEFPLDPIEADDFVSINSEGHFVIKDKPIRFWGTPSYPLKEEWTLPKGEIKTLARELRKMGVNIIRVHTMDSRSFYGENTVFGNQTTTRTLDPIQLNKVDYYISEFKKQGIYVMMDLLTDRKYTAEDGVYHVDSVNNASKEVNFFDPYLIQLQKEYAAQLLNHVNPYTGLAYKDDPVIALIDIVNEGWFLHSVRCDGIKPPSEGGPMSQYHYDMLVGLWNNFLLQKYGTEQAMMEAWKLWPNNSISIENPGFESGLENWEYGYFGSVTTNIEVTDKESHSGEKSFHINTVANGGFKWECFAKNQFASLGSQVYTLNFWAKSEHENSVVINILQNGWVAASDFSISGNEWKKYSMSFFIKNEGKDTIQIEFQLGNVLGNFWLDDVAVVTGEEVLHDGGSLANQDFKLLRIWQNETEYIKQRKVDQSEFYIKIQTDYFSGIYNFLKDEIGVKIPITGSNYLVGIPDFYVQNYTDFIDNHGYWTHNENTPASMIGSPQFTNPIIDLFAGTRIKGKPLTASEYNYEFYNPSANEALFFLSAYGSFHQADMLMIHGYDYGPLVGGVFRNSYDNYHRLFDKAMLPCFAYVYRNGLIAPAVQTVNIAFTKDNVNNLVFRDDEMWGTDAYPNDYPFELIYQHAVQSDFESGDSYNVADYPKKSSSPYLSDTDEIEWDSTGIFSVNTPKFCAFVGKLNQFEGKTIGSVQITGADKSCGVTLLSLDEKDIELSEKMLLTLTTQQKHDEWEFNGYRDLNGHAPLMIEAANVSFNLKNAANAIRVSWLDKHGNPSGYYEVFEKNGDGVIPISINTYDHNGIWFGIEAVTSDPQIDLLDYLSGEYPILGENTKIKWYSNLIDTIDFYWSDDEGATLHEIGKSVAAANNSLTWLPESINNDSCSIVAIASSNPSVSDTITFPVRKFSDDNLIKNGAFTSGMNYWAFYPDPSEDVTYSTLNNEFNMQVNVQPDEKWHYNLSQNEIYLEAGHYALDIDFTIPEPCYTFAYFTFSNQNTWENKIEDDIIMYRWESNKHFRFEFNYSGNKTTPLRFSIQLGGVESSAIIDNIVLKKETKIDIVQNVGVTFQVDMQNEEVSAHGVYLNGSFCNWNPSDAVQFEKNGTVYSATLQLTKGETIEYKFVNGAADDWGQYEILAGSSCAFGNDANRGVVVPDNNLVLDVVCFESCSTCNITSIEEPKDAEICVFPNPAESSFTLANLPENKSILIEIYNAKIQLIKEISINNQSSVQIEIGDVNAGLYFIKVIGDDLYKTIKMIKMDNR